MDGDIKEWEGEGGKGWVCCWARGIAEGGRVGGCLSLSPASVHQAGVEGGCVLLCRGPEHPVGGKGQATVWF